MINLEKKTISFNTIKSYLTGFLFSLILTFIPFWMVMKTHIVHSIILSVVLICAIIQVLVHLFYFLHLDKKSQEGWNMISIIFSSIVIVVIISGSLWIMWNLNYHMMYH